MKNIKFITTKEAVKVVKSNDRVYLHSVAVTPHLLIYALCERGRNKEFSNVCIRHPVRSIQHPVPSNPPRTPNP